MLTMDATQVPNVTGCRPVKRSRKQRMTTREMLKDELDCSPSSGRPIMWFPNLDFGMSLMDQEDLKRALIPQLHLQTKHAANIKRLEHTDPKKPLCDIDYQTHRLAAVSWFAKIPIELITGEDHHSVLIPAVNVMDRYVTTCAHLGDDTRQLLKNIGNIRAACLSLSIKMYAVNMAIDIDIEDLNRHNLSVNMVLDAYPAGKAGKPRLRYIVSDVPGIEEAERQIIAKLNGAVFPTNAQNMISLLCAYLILEYGKPSPLSTTKHILNNQATVVASKLLLKTTLNIAFLGYERWLCIAVCSLLGVTEVCVTEPEERLHVEDSLISLLEKLMPGKVTHTELGELKTLLSQGCVVCSGSFDIRAVRSSLHRLTSMSCSDCRIYHVKDNDRNGATKDSEGPQNKVTRGSYM